ncbi:hypothetical protein TorRG33x02_314440, partial [Trema orientale]
MGGPGNGVDTGLVPLQLDDGEGWEADVEDDDLGAVHDDGGHVPGVLLVPAKADQGGVGLRALVDDGGVLLVAEVEDPDGAIGGDGGEDPHATPGDVVDLLVVGDELGVDGLALNVPDGAGRVDAGGADALGLGLVPVEGGEGPAELAVLVAVEEGFELDAGAGVMVGDAPDAEEVAGGGEEVGLLALLVGNEDGLGGRVRVLEGEGGVGADLAVGVVELYDLDAVGVLLEEAGYGEAVLLVAADAPVHGVDVPGRLVRVDLRSFLLLIGPVLVRIAAGPHIINLSRSLS